MTETSRSDGKSIPLGVVMKAESRSKGRCDANARKGTGTGICDRPLDEHGYCDRAGDHLSDAPEIQERWEEVVNATRPPWLAAVVAKDRAKRWGYTETLGPPLGTTARAMRKEAYARSQAMRPTIITLTSDETEPSK